MSGGESNNSAVYAPCSKLKWWASPDFCCVVMMELPASYLESTVSTAACKIAIVFPSAVCVCFACRVLSSRRRSRLPLPHQSMDVPEPSSPQPSTSVFTARGEPHLLAALWSTFSLLRSFLTTTAMARKKITGEEKSARAKANGYQRGAHRDNDRI